MSSTYLRPSLNFYKQPRSNNNGNVLADLGSVGVWEVGISFPLLSALLPGFSNTRLTLPFALWDASASIPVSLRLGNGIVGLKYWRIPVLILKNKTQLLKNNGTYSATCHLHCCHTTQGRKHPLLLLLLEQLANVHWFDVDVSVNHTYQEPPPQI